MAGAALIPGVPPLPAGQVAPGEPKQRAQGQLIKRGGLVVEVVEEDDGAVPDDDEVSGRAGGLGGTHTPVTLRFSCPAG